MLTSMSYKERTNKSIEDVYSVPSAYVSYGKTK